MVASALRGRRYLHSAGPAGAEPVAEELAEGAAQTAGLVGLDEAAALPGSNNGNGSSNIPARTRGNGVHASASSGADIDVSTSPENS